MIDMGDNGDVPDVLIFCRLLHGVHSPAAHTGIIMRTVRIYQLQRIGNRNLSESDLDEHSLKNSDDEEYV